MSLFFNPLMQNLLVSQAMIACSQKGWSKFSCYLMSQFSAHLATKGYMSESIVVGRAALRLLERFDDAEDQLPYVFATFFGYVALYIEPLQSTCEMLDRGFQFGLQYGDNKSAILNGSHYLHK